MNRKEAAQLINATLPCHRKLPFRDAVQIAILNGLIPPLRSRMRATANSVTVAVNPVEPLATPLPIAYPWVSVNGEFDESILQGTGILEILPQTGECLSIQPRWINGEKHLVIDVSSEWLTEHKSLFPQCAPGPARTSPYSRGVSSTPNQLTLPMLAQVLAGIRAERSAQAALRQKSTLPVHPKTGRRVRQTADNSSPGGI